MLRQQNNASKAFNSLFGIILLLFPILPQYIYVIGRVNVVNFLVICLVVIYLIRAKIQIVKMPSAMMFFWFYFLLSPILYLAQGDIIKAVSYVLCFVFFPYVLIGYINNRERFFQAIDIMIRGGFVLGIIGLLESIMQYNFIQPFAMDTTYEFFYEVRYGLLRIMTTFGQPISYGIFQVFIVALIHYRLNTPLAIQKRRCLKVAYVISVLNIFLSVSRIPIIAFIALQIWFVSRNSKRRVVSSLSFFLIFILLVLIFCEAMKISIPFLDDLLGTIRMLFGDENIEKSSTVGVGDRLNLWSWVYESVKGSWFWGKGITTEFTYDVTEWTTKSSIENQYLFTLYHTGALGLTLLVLCYFSTLIFANKNNKVYGRALGEKKLSFNSLIFILFSIYYFAELGVQESDMTRTYVIFVALLISYNRIILKEKRCKIEEVKNENRIVRI